MDIEKMLKMLITLIEEQEEVEITYKLEKTAQAVERRTSMKIKGIYHCSTTNIPGQLNSWDIRTVYVDVPEPEKEMSIKDWIESLAMVIGGIVILVWLMFSYI